MVIEDNARVLTVTEDNTRVLTATEDNAHVLTVTEEVVLIVVRETSAFRVTLLTQGGIIWAAALWKVFFGTVEVYATQISVHSTKLLHCITTVSPP